MKKLKEFFCLSLFVVGFLSILATGGGGGGGGDSTTPTTASSSGPIEEAKYTPPAIKSNFGLLKPVVLTHQGEAIIIPIWVEMGGKMTYIKEDIVIKDGTNIISLDHPVMDEFTLMNHYVKWWDKDPNGDFWSPNDVDGKSGVITFSFKNRPDLGELKIPWIVDYNPTASYADNPYIFVGDVVSTGDFGWASSTSATLMPIYRVVELKNITTGKKRWAPVIINEDLQNNPPKMKTEGKFQIPADLPVGDYEVYCLYPVEEGVLKIKNETTAKTIAVID